MSLPCGMSLAYKRGMPVQLKDDRFDMLFHSPLKRADQTAQIIWDSRQGDVSVLPSLREVDLYSFQVESSRAHLGTAPHTVLSPGRIIKYRTVRRILQALMPSAGTAQT